MAFYKLLSIIFGDEFLAGHCAKGKKGSLNPPIDAQQLAACKGMCMHANLHNSYMHVITSSFNVDYDVRLCNNTPDLTEEAFTRVVNDVCKEPRRCH